MSTDVREAVAANLRSCVKRGVGLPRRPDPADLYDALGGDGYLALLVMLEFEAALAEVKLEEQRTGMRERPFRLAA